jgi:hypothetical protein
MKKFTTIFCLIGSFGISAETISSRVHSYTQHEGFIRLENGRVVFLKHSEKNLGTPIEWLNGMNVKVETNDQNEVVKLSLVEKTESFEGHKNLQDAPLDFTPTILPSLSAVKAMYERFDGNFKRLSECSDRAHVWGYDEFKKNKIATEKVFAFFTASYINRQRFKWWFHVAPLVSYQSQGVVQKMVLDYRYMDRPVSIKEWTDLMVFSRRECKMTKKFSEYDVNPQTEDCYMMIDSMYNRLPADLKAQENVPPIHRDQWLENEVNNSRAAAFEKKEL